MRFLYIFFLGCTLFLPEGNTNERSMYELPIYLNIEQVVLREDKMVLLTENFGEVWLSNLHIDQKGYYTLCFIDWACANCSKHLEKKATFCKYCLSKELVFMDPKEGVISDYLPIEKVIYFHLEEEGFPLGCSNHLHKELDVHTRIDSEGNLSAGGRATISNDDRDRSVSGSGSVTRDSEGNVHAEVSIEGKVEF